MMSDKKGCGAVGASQKCLYELTSVLFRPPTFLHSTHGEACLHGTRFVHGGLVMLDQVWVIYFHYDNDNATAYCGNSMGKD